jgi:hypothetical protein
MKSQFLNKSLLAAVLLAAARLLCPPKRSKGPAQWGDNGEKGPKN